MALTQKIEGKCALASWISYSHSTFAFGWLYFSHTCSRWQWIFGAWLDCKLEHKNGLQTCSTSTSSWKAQPGKRLYIHHKNTYIFCVKNAFIVMCTILYIFTFIQYVFIFLRNVWLVFLGVFTMYEIFKPCEIAVTKMVATTAMASRRHSATSCIMTLTCRILLAYFCVPLFKIS